MYQRITLIALIGWLALASNGLAQEGWGHLTGRIVAEGSPSRLVKERIDKDTNTCLADTEVPWDDNIVIADDGGLRDAFVMMYFKKKDPRPEVHPSYADAKQKPVVLDNVRCRFVPHAIFVRTGQPIELKNSDDVGHNCHIITFGNEKNVNLAKNDSVKVSLEEADRTPGKIVCDIHKWMDAVILVRDEPYVAITGPDGSFEIRNIPAGTWKFQFWHSATGYMKSLKVPGYQVGKIKADITVTIKDGETVDLGKLVLPAVDLHLRN